jgi:serine/threonine protein kinase
MKTLTETEFNTLIEGAELMKADGFGPKVYRRADATYVKLFRQKRKFSLSAIWPYVQRFRRNSIKLGKRGIDTVQVGDLYDCPAINRTIVTYSELQGELLRGVLANHASQERIEQLAAFLAGLHKKGIYFRSIHLENIVLQPDSTLGLIDIADMRIRPLALGPLRRVRNLCHLLKYEQDVKLLHVDSKLDFFLDSYLRHARLGLINKMLFTYFVHKYIDPKYRPAP